MKNKKRGFALVFVIIALALAMGIFFRYSMNVRSRGLRVVTQQKLSDMEESAKKSMSAGINETYLIDQMIINRRDFNFNGTNTSVTTGTGVKETAFNLYKSRDYFIVKDKYYEKDAAGNFPEGEKIWQSGVSSVYNIENVWLRVNKTNDGGKVSKIDPSYYVDGKNTFSLEKFDREVRFSKGGYYLKSVQVDGTSTVPTQCENKYIYLAKYSEFNSNSKETCYLKSDGSGVENNSYQTGVVDPIASVDPISIYLNKVTGEVKFLVRVKKDIAYVAEGSVVAAFEGIADIRLTYIGTNRNSAKPDTIELINYEINHLGP